MLHDLAIVGVFLAMLILPCLITLRGERTSDDAALTPKSPAKPLPHSR